MAIAFMLDGSVTTTFLLEQRELDRERANRLAAIDREVLGDAVKWRLLPVKVRRELEKKYKLATPAPEPHDER